MSVSVVKVAIEVLRDRETHSTKLVTAIEEIDSLAAEAIASRDEAKRARLLRRITSRAGGVLAEEHSFTATNSKVRDRAQLLS